MELTIVLPCLNEAKTLEVCILKAQSSLRDNDLAGEVIVADNGSTDGSQAIAERLGARVVAVARKGYGSALLGGIEAARGQFVIMGDADDSYELDNLMPFVSRLREGYELVMGNRFKGAILPGAMPVLHRYLGNPVLSRIGRLFFASPAGDFYCGLRGFRKVSVDSLDLQTTGMEFACEMVVKATLQGLRITEVPTRLSPDGRGRPPHLRSWSDGWRGLRFMLLYSPRWLFLYPGSLLILAGSVIGLWLWPEPRFVGRIRLDVQTLLYAVLAILVGFQAVLFSVLTKVFAISEGLLPEDQRLTHLFRYVTLELGLFVGFILIVGGLGGSVFAVGLWRERSFGDLDLSSTLRIVAPSVLALALGFQIVLSSFFLSVLGLKRR